MMMLRRRLRNLKQKTTKIKIDFNSRSFCTHQKKKEIQKKTCLGKTRDSFIMFSRFELLKKHTELKEKEEL
jgi:hypothetical protein